MPTETYTETVTKSRDLCDFCGKEAGSCGSHRCAICDRFACVNCGYSDHWDLMFSDFRTWLCYDCGAVGEQAKEAIRRARKEIAFQRQHWRELGRARVKK